MVSMFQQLAEYWLNYFFGSYTVFTIFFFSIIAYMGFKAGLSAETILVLMVPLVFVFVGNFILSFNINPLILLGMGAIIGIALKMFLGG